MVTGSSEVAPVFAVAGIQKDSEERKDPAQAEERQLPGASPGEGQVQAPTWGSAGVRPPAPRVLELSSSHT